MSLAHAQEKADLLIARETWDQAYQQRQIEIRVLRKQKVQMLEQWRTEQAVMVMRQNMLGKQHVRSVLAPGIVRNSKDPLDIVRDGWALIVANEDKDRATEVFPNARFE